MDTQVFWNFIIILTFLMMGGLVIIFRYYDLRDDIDDLYISMKEVQEKTIELHQGNINLNAKIMILIKNLGFSWESLLNKQKGNGSHDSFLIANKLLDENNISVQDQINLMNEQDREQLVRLDKFLKGIANEVKDSQNG